MTIGIVASALFVKFHQVSSSSIVENFIVTNKENFVTLLDREDYAAFKMVKLNL